MPCSPAESDRGLGRLLDWVNCREDEASRILQVALLKYMLRKALAEKQRLEQANLHYRRKSALRTVVVAVLRSAVRSLQQDRVALPGVDLHVQRERAARRVLIALLRYQLARAKSRNNLLRSIPENLHEQDRWKLLLEKEEVRRETLLVEKLNVMNELRTLQDEKRALERMLEEERKKLIKAKEMQNRLKSDLEIMAADKMEIHLDLEQSRHRISDLEDVVANLQAALISVTTEYQDPNIQIASNKKIMEKEFEPMQLADKQTDHVTRKLDLRSRKQELEEMMSNMQKEYEQVTKESALLAEREVVPSLRAESEIGIIPVSPNLPTQEYSNSPAQMPATNGRSFLENTLNNTINVFMSLWYFIFPFRRIA